MKRSEQQESEVLDRLLGRLGDPVPAAEVESAAERVLQRLRADGTMFSDEVKSVSTPTLASEHRWSFWAAAAALVVMAVMSIAGIRYFMSRDSVHAIVETIGDGLSLEDGPQSRQLHPGERIGENRRIRSNGGAGAVLSLADGSRIEMRSKSVLSLERSVDGVRIRLSGGSIIVTAAKQRGGHLYVETKDCTVSVVGTVFLVETGDAGSRVTVIQGEVQVRQNGVTKRLLPGDQTTTAAMEPAPLIEEIRWSRYWSAYLTSLRQSGVLPAAPLKFETVSISPETVDDATTSRRTVLVCNGIDVTSTTDAARGQCIGRHVSLAQLVAYAYDVPLGGVAGGPKWGHEFRLDAAAADPLNANTLQLRQMLQSLLADRFKLRFHSETRESQGYVLFTVPTGLKLREAVEKQDPVLAREATRMTLRGQTSVDDLAHFLSKRVLPAGDGSPIPVVNKTAAAGVYNYVLKWNASSSNAAALRRALEEQLGLRLEPLPVPQEVLVIDAAEDLTKAE